MKSMYESPVELAELMGGGGRQEWRGQQKYIMATRAAAEWKPREWRLIRHA
jgi:hypothetical protein